jgi:chromosome segregation ATPase
MSAIKNPNLKLFVGFMLASQMAYSQPNQLPKKKVQSQQIELEAPVKAKPATSFPEQAIEHSMREELAEIKKTDEIERNAVVEREAYEQQKADALKVIAARQFKIEGLKIKQDQVQRELEALTVDLNAVLEKRKETEAKYQKVEQAVSTDVVAADKKLQELEEQRKQLETAYDRLAAKEAEAKSNLIKVAIEVQRSRAEIANLDLNVAELNTAIAEVNADEAKARKEWTALRASIEFAKGQRQASKDALDAAKKKLAMAEQDTEQARAEYKTVEKSRAQTEEFVNAEIRRISSAIDATEKAKVKALADKSKAVDETNKLKADLVAAKAKNLDFKREVRASKNEVMESRLALETAKSTALQEEAEQKKAALLQAKGQAKMRKIASENEAAKKIEAGQPWTVTKDCRIQRRPNASSEVVGQVSQGQRLVGSKASGVWVEVLNASGESAYVNGECGSF